MDSEQESDYLHLRVGESRIANAGEGLFTRKQFAKGEILAEYRGPIISSKYAWSEPFTYEDKMLQINDRYCILGRNVGCKANDIVKFGEWSREEMEMIENEGRFPLIKGLTYNGELQVKGDKIFLVAGRVIECGEEVYFSYSYEYWRWFYEEWKKEGAQFLQRWESEKQRLMGEYDKYILVEDSDQLKLRVEEDGVYAKERIRYGEIIIECRGTLVKKGWNLKLNESLGMLFNPTCMAIWKYKQKNGNAEVEREGDKYFIKATYPINIGQQIIINQT